MDAPLDNLTRSLPFTTERADDGDGLTLSGYAAVFNTPTRIDSWEGRFDEVIAPGAFKRTLRARTPVLQFDHGAHPLIGSLPLGRFTKLREDDNGLYVEARLHDNWLTEPVRDAIAEQSITGMSFRFSVVKDEWDESKKVPLRTIREVKLYEAGPVVFPAYESTTVGVRANEFVAALADPAFRVQVARALLIGTSDDVEEAAPRSAADVEEPAASTDPREHSEHNPPTPDARRRALILAGVLK